MPNTACLWACLWSAVFQNHMVRRQPFRSSTARVGRWARGMLPGVCYSRLSWQCRRQQRCHWETGISVSSGVGSPQAGVWKKDRWVGSGESRSLLGAADNVHAISFCLWPCSCVACKNRTLAAQVDVLAADVMVQMECWWYCTAFPGCKDAFLPAKRVPTDQRKGFCEPEFIWVSLQELGSLLQLHH